MTFSIRLTEMQSAKLNWLADRFESAKTPLAQKLLVAAMDDALAAMATHGIPDDAYDAMGPDAVEEYVSERVSRYQQEIRESVSREGEVG